MKIFSNFRNSDTDPFFDILKEKYQDKPFTFWYDKFPDNANQLNINPYNFLFLHEPNEFFGFHTNALHISHLYTGVFTWSSEIIQYCSNAILFTYSGRTVDYDYISYIEDKIKDFKITFLCGTKNLVDGHILRHKVYNLKDQINIPNNWYYVLEDYDHKNEARPGYANYTKDLSHIPSGVDIIGYGRRVLFNDSMFNVVIENVNHFNWYNKIGDNFLTKTVPIYWGCPNISEFGYDERGIIRFNTAEKLLEIINNLTPEVYHQMKPYIDYNYEIAKQDEPDNKLSEFFDNFFELNNI